MKNDTAFRRARACTAENDHQRAVLILAKHFGLHELAKCVRGVMLIHEASGHLPEPLADYMCDLRRELLAAIEAAHGHDVRAAAFHCL